MTENMVEEKTEKIQEQQLDGQIRAEQVEHFIADEQRHRDNAEVFRVQLDKLRQSKAASDQQRQDRVGELLDDHDGATSKGLLEHLLKMKDPQNSQLLQNIDKVSAGMLSEKRKAGQAGIAIKKLRKEIDEERFDSQSKVLFEKLGEFLDLCQRAEVSLDGLRAVVFACEDPRFFLRGGDLGFPKSHEIVFDSILNREHLPTIGLPEALERIANLRDSYGPVLIRHSNNQLRNVPLIRDGSVTPQWMEGRE